MIPPAQHHAATRSAAPLQTDAPRSLAALRLLIVVATLAAFAPVCGHEFTAWDDRWTIETNPWFNPPSLHGLAAAWSGPDKGLYIPVTYTVWAALSAVSQVNDPATGHTAPNPWVFHTFNLILHVLAALVVFSILRRLIRIPPDSRAIPLSRPACGARSAVQETTPNPLTRHPAVACAAALLFALHPVQVDSVAWASGMKDVLYGLLSLVAIRQYIAWTDAGSAHSRRRWPRYALATVAFVAAMLAKPTAMVVPIIVAAIDGLILRRRTPDVLKSAGPWFLLAIPVAVIAKIVQPGLGVPTALPWVRPFIASDAFTFYLRKLLWPAHLAVIYGRTPEWVMWHWWVYLTLLVPIAVIVAIAAYRPGRRWLAAAAIAFVACISPVLGFTPFLFQFHSTVADHYLYLAMFGIALAAAFFLARFWSRRIAIGSMIILTALGIRTLVQTFTWRDSITLFAHAVAVSPDSATAQNNLGTNLWDAGDHAAAAPHFIRAAQLRPDYVDPHKNLVLLFTERGRLDDALAQLEAAVQLEQRLPVSLRPQYESDVIGLARILVARGRQPEAIDYLNTLLREQSSPSAAKLLAEIRAARATLPATAPPSTDRPAGPARREVASYDSALTALSRARSTRNNRSSELAARIDVSRGDTPHRISAPPADLIRCRRFTISPSIADPVYAAPVRSRIHCPSAFASSSCGIDSLNLSNSIAST